MNKQIRTALISGAAVVALVGGSTVVALAAPQPGDDDGGRHPASTSHATVSHKRAVSIAKHRIPGARVTEVEVEREHGRTVWEVDLVKNRREYEVTINAATGSVISSHRERDHDRDHERDHDRDRGADHDHDD